MPYPEFMAIDEAVRARTRFVERAVRDRSRVRLLMTCLWTGTRRWTRRLADEGHAGFEWRCCVGDQATAGPSGSRAHSMGARRRAIPVGF